MSSYVHSGTIIQNGSIEIDNSMNDDSIMKVLPADDRFHLPLPVIGNFEWWYFDLIDSEKNILMKIVLHVGTNPLRTRIYPQIAISISTPEYTENFTKSYSFSEIRGDSKFCFLKIGEEVEIKSTPDSISEYFVKVNLNEFSAELRFESVIEGWKPLGDKIRYIKSGRNADFMWIIPVPKAKITGTCTYKNKEYNISGAIGYHDHNYYSVDKKKPLYLDSSVKKWYWGKCYCGDYTLIFMDTWFKSLRIKSLLVSKGNKIIHSSNNLVESGIEKTGFDLSLKAEYPSSLNIRLNQPSLELEVRIDSVKILDKKDLLEGVPLMFNWMIKKIISRPVYFGLFAHVQLEINGNKLAGFGNYEYMFFRE